MATVPRMPTAEDFRACLAETPRTVPTARGPVEYAERGHGEPVLAVHGTRGGWDQGLVSCEFLSLNGFRVVAPSRPGYLGTPLSTGRTPAEQADALAALLDALALDRTMVLAGSGGGPTGYELAARHPDRVSGLVQVDSVYFTDTAPSRLVQMTAGDLPVRAMTWLLRRSPRRALTAVLQSSGTYSRRAAADRAAELTAVPGRTAWLEVTLAASLGTPRRRAGTRNDLTVGPLPPLEHIACPTLIVHGRLDKAVKPAHAEHAHAHIAGSELTWMNGSHVAFILEAADWAPACVAHWLRGGAERAG